MPPDARLFNAGCHCHQDFVGMVIRFHGATNNLLDLGRHLATEDVAKKDIDVELSAPCRTCPKKTATP